MPAPIVVAMGRDLLAQKIRDLATEHGIPLMENRPLAQALYKSVDVGGFDSIRFVPGSRRHPRAGVPRAG